MREIRIDRLQVERDRIMHGGGNAGGLECGLHGRAILDFDSELRPGAGPLGQDARAFARHFVTARYTDRQFPRARSAPRRKLRAWPGAPRPAGCRDVR